MQIRELHDYTRRRWAVVLNVSMGFCTVREPPPAFLHAAAPLEAKSPMNRPTCTMSRELMQLRTHTRCHSSCMQRA